MSHPMSVIVDIVMVIGCNPHILVLPLFQLTASSDFTPGPYTVTFSAGQLYATLMVSPIDDNTAELSEYFMLMITTVDRPDVVEIGSPNTSVITIKDNDGACVYVHACAHESVVVGLKVSSTYALTMNAFL